MVPEVSTGLTEGKVPAVHLGCNSTLHEFVCGHGSCLLTETGCKQHRHCPKRTTISNIPSYNMQTQGVPNSFFQGLSEYTPHTPPPPPPPLTAWKDFWMAPLPPSIVDFIYQVLWRKLKVAKRLSSWTRDSRCPVCGVVETTDHALYR